MNWCFGSVCEFTANELVGRPELRELKKCEYFCGVLHVGLTSFLVDESKIAGKKLPILLRFKNKVDRIGKFLYL